MTTSRERVIRSLCHRPLDRAPRDLWVGHAVEAGRADDVAEIRYRFPPDIEQPDDHRPHGQRTSGRPGEIGSYTDAWGCHWRVDAPGTSGQPVEPPLAEKAHIAAYQPPWELLDRGCIPRVNRGCAATSRFVLAWAETRPMDRVRLLRGPETAAVDLAQGDAATRGLVAAMHDFACREMEMWAQSDVDGVAFSDDLGWDSTAPRPAEIWQAIFKPLYRDYCNILHGGDKFAFLDLGGDVTAILPDLVEMGVDAIHCELGRTNVEQVAADFRGQITFWGEIGPDEIASRPDQVRAAVTRVRSALDFGRGGVIAQCHWRPGLPLKNVAALFDQWAQPLGMRTRTSA